MTEPELAPHPPIVGNRVVLRPTTETDLDLLAGWFTRPDVVKYWDGVPLSREEVASDYLGRQRPEVECFVVLAEDVPVGWIQYWEDTEDERGIDMVLLEEHRGRGIGRAAVHAIADYLLGTLGWSTFTVDPDDWNEDGKAFWLAVGFERVHLVTEEDGRKPYVLMRWNP